MDRKNICTHHTKHSALFLQEVAVCHASCRSGGIRAEPSTLCGRHFCAWHPLKAKVLCKYFKTRNSKNQLNVFVEFSIMKIRNALKLKYAKAILISTAKPKLGQADTVCSSSDSVLMSNLKMLSDELMKIQTALTRGEINFSV